jgi:hypothetical protein
MTPRRVPSAKRLPVFAIACLALAACSEKMDQPAPQASAPVAESAPKVRPAGAQFAASQENAGSLAAVLTGGVCSVENVVTVPENQSSTGEKPNSYVGTRDKSYRMVGFAVNKDAGTVPAKVDIVLSGIRNYQLSVDTGRPRQDVADYFKTPAFDKAGYLVDVAFSDVEPGDYAIYFVDGSGGTKAACATNQSVTIR